MIFQYSEENKGILAKTKAIKHHQSTTSNHFFPAKKQIRRRKYLQINELFTEEEKITTNLFFVFFHIMVNLSHDKKYLFFVTQDLKCLSRAQFKRKLVTNLR